MRDDPIDLTLGMLPARAARRWGAREALCFAGRRWTFAEVAAAATQSPAAAWAATIACVIQSHSPPGNNATGARAPA